MKQPTGGPKAIRIKDQAFRLHSLGANVVPLGQDGKNIADYSDWTVRRQTATELEALDFTKAHGLAVVLGVDEWRAVVVDDAWPWEWDLRRALDTLGLPPDYQWTLKNDRREYLIVRASDVDRSDERWKAVENPSLDVRWGPGILAVPPTNHPKYGSMTFMRGRPDAPPLRWADNLERSDDTEGPLDGYKALFGGGLPDVDPLSGDDLGSSDPGSNDPGGVDLRSRDLETAEANREAPSDRPVPPSTSTANTSASVNTSASEPPANREGAAVSQKNVRPGLRGVVSQKNMKPVSEEAYRDPSEPGKSTPKNGEEETQGKPPPNQHETHQPITSPSNFTDGVEGSDFTDGVDTPAQSSQSLILSPSPESRLTDGVNVPGGVGFDFDRNDDDEISGGTELVSNSDDRTDDKSIDGVFIEKEPSADPSATADHAACQTVASAHMRDGNKEAKHENDPTPPPLGKVDAVRLWEKTKDRHNGNASRAKEVDQDDAWDRKPSVPYIVVPRAIREMLLNKYENKYGLLKDHPGLMAYFQLAVFGVPAGHRGGVISDLSTVYDTFGVTATEKITGEQLIGMYRYFIQADIKVLSYHSNGLAREIIEHPLPPDLAQMVNDYLTNPEDYNDLVYLIDGRTVNPTNRKAITRQRIEEAGLHEPVIQPPPETIQVQTYLHNISPKLFGTVKEHVPEAMQIAREGDFFAKESERTSALARLQQICAFPAPIYKTADYSPRLYPYGENTVGNLRSELRPALYTERDVELDLSKAHLSALAKAAREDGIDASGIEEYLQRHMDGDIDLWSELTSVVDVEDKKAARKAVKRIYTAVYGGSEQTTFWEMSTEYADRAQVEHPGYDPFRPTLEHPLGRSVMRVRERLLERIDDNGGMLDANGRFLHIEDFKECKNPDRSLMSYVATSYEIKLIAAAIDAAQQEKEWASKKENRRPRFQIWLLQHDGFTMRVRRRSDKERWIKHLQDAVAEKASELGITTRLEVAYGLEAA